MDRVLRYAYRRLGRRYPLTVVVLQFQIAHLLALGGIVLLRLYQPMSNSTFLLLLVVAELLVALDNVSSTLLARRLLIGLPAINILTGVIVAGIEMNRHGARLDDLGPAVVIAVLVAFIISVELTILLSRSIFDPIDQLRSATERVGRGDLSTRVPVVSNDETGRLARSFNDMVAGLSERERLHEAFDAYVGPDVAEMVLRDGTHLDGKEQEVTVLSLDIRDFTQKAEKSTPRRVVDFLNEFYGLVVPIIERHGGRADKYVGDGLLAIFGTPEPLADHADRAVAAALDVAVAVRDRYDDVRVGIGVNSGPVIAGTIGGGGHVEFTVIGDPVNTADRVEQVTRQTGDTVLVTEATRRLLTRDHGRFENRPAVPLKGKTERVQLWAPKAVSATAGGSPDGTERSGGPAASPTDRTPDAAPATGV